MRTVSPPRRKKMMKWRSSDWFKVTWLFVTNSTQICLWHSLQKRFCSIGPTRKCLIEVESKIDSKSIKIFEDKGTSSSCSSNNNNNSSKAKNWMQQHNNNSLTSIFSLQKKRTLLRKKVNLVWWKEEKVKGKKWQKKKRQIYREAAEWIQICERISSFDKLPRKRERESLHKPKKDVDVDRQKS